MMRQVYAFVAREFKLLISDKVALFWVIVWPIFWILMVAYVFAPPEASSPVRITVGVVNYDIQSEGFNFTSMDFIEIMDNITYNSRKLFDVRMYESEEKLVEDLKKGRLDAGLIIPANFTMELHIGTAQLEIMIGARDPYSASITQNVLSNFIGEFSRRTGIIKVNMTMTFIEQVYKDNPELVELIRKYMYGLVSPVEVSFKEVKPEALATREKTLGWFVIGAIGMTFLTTGLSEGASTIYREKTIGSLKRILVAPISPTILIISLALGVIVILLFTALAVIIGGLLIARAHIEFNPLDPLHLLTVVLFVAGAYMSFGMGLILSLLARTYRSAGSLGVILGLLASFTTGVWFPKTWMPEPIRFIADCSPFTWVIDTIRGILIFEETFADISATLIKIAMAIIAIMLLDVLVYKYKLRKVLESM